MRTYERWIDQMIKKAQEKGEFEDVKQYEGKPVDNSDYFNAPAEDRLCFHILKNQGFVPQEVALSKEIRELQERIKACNDEKEKAELEKQLADKQNLQRIQLEHRATKNPNSMGFRG